MASLQFSVAIRNAMLDAIETAVGTAPILKIRSGAKPVDCAAADAGTVLATLNLPSDWMAAASGGQKAKAGTWQDTNADATGTAGHWRLYDSGGVNCVEQGDLTISGGGGSLTLDSVNLTSGQSVTVTSWTFTGGNP